MRSSESLARTIIHIFQSNSNPENRHAMEAYMKNHFVFFGIKTPERNRLLKPILKEVKGFSYRERVETAKLLYDKQERECHYAALAILSKGNRQIPSSAIELYKELIMKHSWWDTVDMIASNLCGDYFRTYPDLLRPVSGKWAQSSCMWVRRSALLHQLKYKEQTDEELLFETIKTLKEEKEFFIEKAIGWALREYSKTNPDAVLSFLETQECRPLSRREGLKWMKNKGMLST